MTVRKKACDGEMTCPKCGSHEGWSRPTFYEEFGRGDAPSNGEWLEQDCERCTYTLFVRPLDYVTPPPSVFAQAVAYVKGLW